jgi:hypothetical protein
MAGVGHLALAARGLERWAGALSIAASLVHGGLTQAHFAEWWGYGAFFLVASTAQLVLGLALLLDPFDPAKLSVPMRTAKRRLYATGLVGMAALVVFYVVTRVVGIPGGPHAGEVEAVAPIDLVAKAAELGVIGSLGWLLHASRRAGGDD